MDNPKFRAMFSRNADNTPMSEYPVNNMQKIINFSEVCYNTAAEFVDGYGPDSVQNSKGGKWCKQVAREMLPYCGKIPGQYNLRTPIVKIRPKWFRAALDACGGNAEEALTQCVKAANEQGSEPEWCESAYTMYKQIYEDKLPPLPQPYKEEYAEAGCLREKDADEKPSSFGKEGVEAMIVERQPGVEAMIVERPTGVDALRVSRPRTLRDAFESCSTPRLESVARYLLMSLSIAFLVVVACMSF